MHIAYLTYPYLHLYCIHRMIHSIHSHQTQIPQIVQLDTMVSLFIAFAVACVSTSIQGLVAHAFRQTIGDIIVSDNSLADVDRITPMLPAPPLTANNTPRQNTERRVWMATNRNTLYTAVNNPIADTHHNMNRNSWTDIDNINDDTFHKELTPEQYRVSLGKRLDARKFFQSLPMQT
jgi:hypothetical protein